MPAHNSTAGSIILEQAYAASKMLDNSGWNGLLRNKITPSDIDHPAVPLCFDNRGAVMFVDFSINCESWEALGRRLKGQRWLYENIIRWGPHCAVVCKHSVTPEMRRHIDTLRDVERFQVMVWDFEPVLSPTYEGSYWQRFVIAWVNETDGPLRFRRRLLGLNAGLIRPQASTTPPMESP
jgi:hypothetical protein